MMLPWEQRFRGKRWSDMPGSDNEMKRINFALWRRGLITLIVDDQAESGLRMPGSLNAYRPRLQKTKPGTASRRLSRAKRKPGPQGLPNHMRKQCDEAEMLALADRIKCEAVSARLDLAEASMLGGLRRNDLNPSKVKKAGATIKARMEALLKLLVQRNGKGKEAV